MHRFFLSSSAIQGSQVVINGNAARQIRNVLRLKPGEGIVVLDNQGLEYDVVLEMVGADRVLGLVRDKRSVQGEPATKVTLYQGVLKGEKFELVLQKATELGVYSLVPLLTRRSVPQYKPSELAGKMSRWRRIMQEAAEQCGRGKLPPLEQPITFKAACDKLQGVSIVPWEGEKVRSLKEFLRTLTAASSDTFFNLLIGPEGGFEPEEVEYAKSRGAGVVSLGRRILRSETAALAALSILLYELGEMGK